MGDATGAPVLARRRFLAVAAGAVASPAVLRADTAVRMRLAHSLPPIHPVHAALEFMAAQVRDRSSGGMEITVFANGELGQEVQLIDFVKTGRLDMAKASAGVIERVAPAHRVFNLPFLFRSQAHWQAAITDAVGEEILASSAREGLVGLTFYEAGARSFYGKSKIERPDDLKGLRIRIQPSPTMIRMMALFGAQPVQLAWDVTYSALQTGLVDGAENSLAALVVGRHGEVARHYAFDEHTMVPDVLVISAQRWAGLDATQRTILQDAAKASFRHMGGLWAGFEADSRRAAERMGVTFSAVDKQPFVERTAPLRVDFADDPRVMSLISRIEQAA